MQQDLTSILPSLSSFLGEVVNLSVTKTGNKQSSAQIVHTQTKSDFNCCSAPLKLFSMFDSFHICNSFGFQLEPGHFMLVQAFIFKVCPAWLELQAWITQGLKKELSCHPGQGDPSREVKFCSHLPMGRGPGKLCTKYIKRNVNEDFPRASTTESYFSKRQAGIQAFLKH